MPKATDKPEAPALTLSRELRAPATSVWRAWTQPQALKRWFFPSNDIVFETVEVDLKVGGRWRIVGRMPDGERHRVGGVYQAIEPERRLVFTWAWESTPDRQSLVTVELAAKGPCTELTLRHERFLDEAARDRHQQGWSGSLDRLERAMSDEKRRRHGHFHWNELMTRDVEKAKAFYAASLGWRYENMPMPDAPAGSKPYVLAFSGDEAAPAGGIFDISGPEFGGMPDGWMAYICVDDVDRRLQLAVAAGAKIMKPQFDVAGVGRIAILIEPGGAMIGWMTPAQ